MTPTLKLVIYMAILTWLLILVAALVRTRGWTLQGTLLAAGNRENQGV